MPLIIPAQYATYRLMGIDPGLNFTGIAIFDIDYKTNKIIRIEAFTLINDKLKDHTGLDLDLVSERNIKLYKLKDAICWCLYTYNPSYVVCEAPFYNRFMPMAYGALLEIVSMIYATTLQWNNTIGFHSVAPLLVKKLIGTKVIKNDSIKGKLIVKEGIKAIPEIISVLSTPIDDLSEHAIDAIAVCYTLINFKE